MEIEQIKHLMEANLKSIHYSVNALETLLFTLRSELDYNTNMNDVKTVDALNDALQHFNAIYKAVHAIRKTEIK